MTSEEMVRRLLYRDGLMLIVDKPAGLSVHKGPKGGPSLEDYFDGLRFGLPRLPSLAHRLDKETSGCLVLGRHRKALANLGDLFRYNKVGKTYWALVEGGPEAEEGTIDLPLGRLDDTRGWWMKHDPAGLPSVTQWRVMGRMAVGGAGSLFSVSRPPASLPVTAGLSVPSPACGGGSGRGNNTNTDADISPLPTPPPQAGEGANRASGGSIVHIGKTTTSNDHLTWVALTPITGRTHQLRVHCATMGFPILGDDIYGSAARHTPGPRNGPRLHLHAREIVVPLYKNKPPIAVTAPAPPHMRERLMACGWNGDEPPRD